MTFKVLIIDDEPPARNKIKRFLADEQEIEIAGEAEDGLQALNLIEKVAPDIIFLDIQMPQMTGLELVSNLSDDNLPVLIFTTAYDQYAIKAFEMEALDYLLKPFDKNRFQKALQRAKEKVEQKRGGTREDILQILQSLKPKNEFLKRFLVKQQERLFFVDAVKTDWLEASGNYVSIHVGEKEYLVRDTLNHLEAKLDPDQFMRIHRSYVVRIGFIQEIQSLGGGEYTIVMENQKTLNIGRKYKQKILDLKL